MSGQTIEVINTDAEGRLVLADAMTWAQRQYKPEVMVDLATLTGAMIISLGHEYGGMFSNDDGLAEQLAAAGKASGDKLWRMPMGEAYDKIMDSPIADMKNSAVARGRLDHRRLLPRRFVEEGVKWAHLDIAGMVWADKAEPSLRQGRDRLRRRPARPLHRRQSRGLSRRLPDAGRFLPSRCARRSSGCCRASARRCLRRGERLLVVAGDGAARAARRAAVDLRAGQLPPARRATMPESQPILLSHRAEPANGATNIALADGSWREEALGFERAFYFFDSGAARRGARGLAGAEASGTASSRATGSRTSAGRWVQGP